MNQNTDMILKQAFDLIEDGNLEDAKALLLPVVETEKDNADVWWLYAHAVTDPETARLALDNVLRIDPEYPDARDLLDQLNTQQEGGPADGIPEFEKDPSFIPPMPSSVPGIKPLQARSEASGFHAESPDELPDDIFSDEDESAESFYRRPIFYVPLITLLLVVALAIVVLKPFAVNSPAPATLEVQETPQTSALEATPTVESLVTDQPTATVETLATEVMVVPTEVSATSEAVAGFADVASALSEFTLANDGTPAFTDTSIGHALTVSVCTSAGKEMRELLPNVMNALAKASQNYASQAQAIAVKMVDCTTTPNTTLLWIGANMADAISFASGTLADKDFEAKWQPIK